jgi:hypothetical protein
VSVARSLQFPSVESLVTALESVIEEIQEKLAEALISMRGA